MYHVDALAPTLSQFEFRLFRFSATMSTSPFAPLQEELRSLLFVDGGRTYQTGLSIIQGMLGISMVLITASLWLRLRGGEKAWLFRVQRTPAGVWIRPHYVYSALIFSLIFIIRKSISLRSERNKVCERR